MSLRFLSFLVLLFLPSQSMASERLLVASVDGFLYEADLNTGGFVPFASGGQVSAMAADHENLYAIDELGQLLVVDLDTGALRSLVQLRIEGISALTATETGLFIGSRRGFVARVDPETGETLERRSMPMTGTLASSSGRFAQGRGPAPVSGLVSLGGHLIAAAADGTIYRAPLDSGEFSLLGRFCLPGLQDLIVDGDDLIGGFSSGFVIRVDGSSGAFLSARWLAPMTAMAMSSGEVLVHSDGRIERFDEQTGASLGTLQSSYYLNAMLVVGGE